jgi:hypothetical protein
MVCLTYCMFPVYCMGGGGLSRLSRNGPFYCFAPKGLTKRSA